MGAISDVQVAHVRTLVTDAGQPFEYVSLPTTPHSLHGSDPRLYVDTLLGWANALDEAEAKQLYEEYHVPASGVPLFQAATANLNPFAETKVDTKNPERGPLLLISGASDNTVPTSMVEGAFKLQAKHHPDDTELVTIPDRGHSLTIDSGWRAVADTALEFVQRNVAR